MSAFLSVFFFFAVSLLGGIFAFEPVGMNRFIQEQRPKTGTPGGCVARLGFSFVCQVTAPSRWPSPAQARCSPHFKRVHPILPTSPPTGHPISIAIPNYGRVITTPTCRSFVPVHPQIQIYRTCARWGSMAYFFLLAQRGRGRLCVDLLRSCLYGGRTRTITNDKQTT